MINQLDNFYLEKNEPVKSCLMVLRNIILRHNEKVTERWYYRLPCFFYDGHMFCYLGIDKKNGMVHLIMYPGKRLNHPKLALIKGRDQSKTLVIAPDKDIDIIVIGEIFKEAFSFFE